MVNLPVLKIVACCAAHDEITEPRNFAFSHCRTNAICSHGNKIIDAAIRRGKIAGLISPERATSLLQLIEEVRIELIRWADRMATWRRHLRLKKLEPSDLNLLESMLVEELGHDRDQWRKRHREKQLEIAKPILETVQYLQSLGLLTCNNEPVHVDVESLILATDTK